MEKEWPYFQVFTYKIRTTLKENKGKNVYHP